MPVYEFTCNACGARVSLFVRVIGSEVNGTCERCGSPDLQRVFSRFAVLRAPVDPTALNKNRLLDGVDYTNPASMADLFRRMQDDFHDEPNEHMDEVVKRLEYGEAVQDALGLDMHDHAHDHGDTAAGGAGRDDA